MASLNHQYNMPTESLTSGLKTADAVISDRPCFLRAVALFGDGTNAVTVVLYDNATTNSGTVVYKGYATTTGGHLDILPGEGVWCVNGIYLDITQGGASGCIVYYA